jgi:putative membrane protein
LLELKPGRPASALAAILIVSLAGACNRRSASATRTGTAESPYAATDTAATHSTTGVARGDTAVIGDTASPAVTDTAGFSDANIFALLDEANMADSAAGAYAVKHAVSADVKAFARLMMGEHHALRAQGQQLAKRLGITPEAPEPDPVMTAALSEMAALQGATKMTGFDSTYIGQEIIAHQAVLDLAGKAHDAARNPQLKKLIEQAKPVIQKHLDRAQAIEKKFRKATT